MQGSQTKQPSINKRKISAFDKKVSVSNVENKAISRENVLNGRARMKNPLLTNIKHVLSRLWNQKQHWNKLRISPALRAA